LQDLAKKSSSKITTGAAPTTALLGNASEVFEKSGARQDEKKRLKKKEDRLHKQIGQLHMEVDFLKEACDELGIGIPENNIR